MTKTFSNLLRIVVIVLTIAFITPFVINCFFAYPQTDDFCYSSISRSMGFLKAQYHIYVTWSGRFTSTALLSVNPLVYGSFAGYRLVFAILILAQLASIYILTDVATKKTLSWQAKLIFTSILFFTYLDQMEDIRSGLYWMAGVVTYQVAETLLVLYVALLLFMHHAHNKVTLGIKCTAIILAFLLGGTNEIVMALVLLTTLLFVLNRYLADKTANLFMVIISIVVTFGNLVVIFSPGTFVRLAEYHQRENLFVILWNALNGALTSAEVWITSPLTLILTGIILYAVISKPQLRELFNSLKIKYSVALLFFLTILCFFIPYWSTGMTPVNRVLNMIYLFFLLGWLMNSAIIFSRYSETILQFIKKIPTRTGCLVAATYLVVLFSLGTSNFMLVSKNLLSGESFKYSLQMQQRESQIINSENDNCMLENITTTPKSLYFYFVSRDPKYWVNGCYASYFGKKSISLIKEQDIRINEHPCKTF